MSKNFNICCPECFSKNLYKYGKDKTGKQKYQCKTCYRQFTKDSNAKKNLIIQNVLFVAQELIYIMITNIILDLNVTPKNVIIFMLF